MIKGKVISFDRIKGYGFVAPEIGGDDVFIHVNDLHGDKDLLAAGSIVEFRLEEGERGPKASVITVLHPAEASATTYAGAGRTASGATADDETAEVLTADEFVHEVTEALLRVEPELTSRQIVDIRKRLVRTAQEHGWADR